MMNGSAPIIAPPVLLPMIDNIDLAITRNPHPAVNPFDVTLAYRIRWLSFAAQHRAGRRALPVGVSDRRLTAPSVDGTPGQQDS